MASSPRVPCVQETARQDRYEIAEGFNVTGTPQTVVDTVCGGQAPSWTDALMVHHRCCCYPRLVLSCCCVGYSWYFTTWFLNPVLLTLPMHGVLIPVPMCTAPNTEESAEDQLHCCWHHCDYLCNQLCYCS